MHKSLSRSALSAACCLLIFAGGCTPVASVRRIKPEFKPAVGTDAAVVDRLAAVKKLEQGNAAAAIGAYLSIAKSALEGLKKNPSDADALKAYNYAVARVFSVMHKSGINPWTEPFRTPEFLVSRRGKETKALRNPASYDFVPCDALEVSGSFFKEAAERPGIGATVVAAWKGSLEDHRDYFIGSKRFYYGVTGVARFEGNQCTIEIVDPLAYDTVQVAGHTFPLAGNFTDAIGIHLIKDKPQAIGLARMLNPGKYQETTQLYRLQPFDPNKTPILLVHGLQDTPATWVPLFNSLIADPVIRKNCQFWFFSYASGDPFPYSAIFLRKELDLMAKKYPHRPILIVGHSMGGLVTRLMISDSGESIWREIFETAPNKTKMSAETLALMKEALIFKSRQDISRAIFIATPHRGSDMASNWIGRLGSKLVKLPTRLIEVGAEVVSTPVAAVEGKEQLLRIPTSIDTLSPTNRFLVAMNKVPLSSRIPFHQIMGDRGRGNTPKRSDGVVAYWSSHLEGAQSEKIVPSGHMANRDPQGIAEVQRIIKEHVEK